MTTAHRPTFDPARGKEAARGEAYHQRLLPAHKTLKYRQPLQGNPEQQARRDLKAELLRSEAKAQAKKEGRELDDDEDIKDSALRMKSGADDEVESGVKRKLAETSTGDAEAEEKEDYEAKKRRILAETKDIDADSDAASEASSEESDSDDDEEDETAQLMAELAKIKAERAEAAAKAAAEQARKDEVQREKDIALGNPLLNGGSGSGGGGAEYGVKRRWDDDVVFRNQGRGTEERGKEKRFVNDLLRSDFHRRFMDKLAKRLLTFWYSSRIVDLLPGKPILVKTFNLTGGHVVWFYSRSGTSTTS
ncbi:complexed with cef1p [Recurvomyces mirabilis]|uniref:Complexed with cef1p n=1 Tax=Recurvomyces mirabilis TaxID=574656 RepID=A0AAE1C312_9PEZI|nr:complexed with cef1p [Recurvomyces mirabilis]KAK5153886.1 complexed with cef1p [Recurvomyces mirabilis]